MTIRTSFAAVTAPLLFAALSGCGDTTVQPTAPVEAVEPSFSRHGSQQPGARLTPKPVEAVEPSFSRHGGGLTGIVVGGGHFDAGVDVTFAFGVVQFGGFDAIGRFRFATEIEGEAIIFHGRAICLAVDDVNDRAWIGGVITKNRSTRPAFTQPIHDVGRDIWFRVVDYGEGGNAPQADRLTFVGFEGSAGIITSTEYCQTRDWPDADARTSPVTQGNVQVHAR